MLIGSRIIPKRSDRRTVTVFGTPYVFMNLAGDGHFVAEVKKQRDIDCFLANPEAYYALKTTPALARPTAPSADTDAAVLAAAAAAAGAAAGSPEPPAAPPREEQPDTRTNDEIAADEFKADLDARDAAASANQSLPTLADYPAEQVTEAKELLLVAPAAIGKKIGKASSMAVVRCALLLEKEAKEPRPFVVEQLEKALELAKSANLQG